MRTQIVISKRWLLHNQSKNHIFAIAKKTYKTY
nr:MAG TPA: hypothetical protein [Crassvirales sp.]